MEFVHWIGVCVFLVGGFTCRQDKFASVPIYNPSATVVGVKSNCQVNQSANILMRRFPPPSGFERIPADSLSFASYLRYLPLKAHGEQVRYHTGALKPNSSTYAAVVDLPIGQADLHQCADAVIRLRAEYLWRQGRFEDIRFRFTNGFIADYNRWRNGERISVKGNQVSWHHEASPSDAYVTFWSYLQKVFMYAGTWSLEQELHAVIFENMSIGDVLIQGGFPGHAIIVVDKAMKPDSQDFAFLLAQSYMPAQEIQILHNPSTVDECAWYFASDMDGSIITPEWTFRKSDLKRF